MERPTLQRAPIICTIGIWLTAVALRTEGRIEPSDGTLMCSYHGWRFQGDGKCTLVPQALDGKANAAACASSWSWASSRPTQVTCPELAAWAWCGMSISKSFMHVLVMQKSGSHLEAAL